VQRIVRAQIGFFLKPVQDTLGRRDRFGVLAVMPIMAWAAIAVAERL
jgi:hypothetical protein